MTVTGVARNPEVQRRSQQKHYHANRENEIARAYQRKLVNQARLRDVIIEAKSVPCADCSGSWIPPVMEFHHLSDKDDAVSKMVTRNVSVARLKREIEKCIVVCSNCHRIRTFGAGWSNGRTLASEAS